MIAPRRKSKAEASALEQGRGGAVAEGESRSTFSTFMKWVGIAAALLSFGSAVYAVIHSQAELRERHRVVSEELASGHAQQGAGDYAGAWDSFAKAASVAEVDGVLAKLLGGLSEERETIGAAQEDLAMDWIRAAKASQDHPFTEVADKVSVVLTSGANAATGARKGDLLAHLGWAYFLKGRSGADNVRPEVPYREAVAADPKNPYANVFWGHWILWNRGSLSDATTRFTAALSTGRARAEVRRFQLAALANVRSDESEAAWLQVVDDMNKGNEPIDASTRRALYDHYAFALNNDGLLRKLLAAVPVTDQAQLQQMLVQSGDLDSDRQSVLTTLMAKMSKVAAAPVR
jgi:hypothetical protein